MPRELPCRWTSPPPDCHPNPRPHRPLPCTPPYLTRRTRYPYCPVQPRALPLALPYTAGPARAAPVVCTPAPQHPRPAASRIANAPPPRSPPTQSHTPPDAAATAPAPTSTPDTTHTPRASGRTTHSPCDTAIPKPATACPLLIRMPIPVCRDRRQSTYKFHRASTRFECIAKRRNGKGLAAEPYLMAPPHGPQQASSPPPQSRSPSYHYRPQSELDRMMTARLRSCTSPDPCLIATPRNQTGKPLTRRQPALPATYPAPGPPTYTPSGRPRCRTTTSRPNAAPIPEHPMLPTLPTEQPRTSTTQTCHPPRPLQPPPAPRPKYRHP